MTPHSLEGLVAQVGRKAPELARLVHMLGRDGLESQDGALDGALRGSVLELDDVAARDDLGDAVGLDDGRERGREGQGKQRSNGEEVHGGGLGVRGGAEGVECRMVSRARGVDDVGPE